MENLHQFNIPTTPKRIKKLRDLKLSGFPKTIITKRLKSAGRASKKCYLIVYKVKSQKPKAGI